METALRVPPALTPELSDVLGMMIFETGPIAHLFRDTGAEIPRRCEDEQAFVLHWLLTLVQEHGADWRPRAGDAIAGRLALRTEAEAAKGKTPLG